MFGQWIPVNAEVAELPMLSAHADSDELGMAVGFARTQTPLHRAW